MVWRVEDLAGEGVVGGHDNEAGPPGYVSITDSQC
jgi:hypothetical protein